MTWSTAYTDEQIELLKVNETMLLWCIDWKQEAFKAMGRKNRGYMIDQGFFIDDDLEQVLKGCLYRLRSDYQREDFKYNYLLGE